MYMAFRFMAGFGNIGSYIPLFVLGKEIASVRFEEKVLKIIQWWFEFLIDVARLMMAYKNSYTLPRQAAPDSTKGE